MLTSRYFVPSFLLLIAVGMLHWVASTYGYYWTVYWYDFMMHFLGGAWVVAVSLWVLSFYMGGSYLGHATMRNLLVWVLLVGVSWEIFELLMGFSSIAMPGYIWDTTHDLIMDVLGGMTTAILSGRTKL